MRSLKWFALPAVAALCCFLPTSQSAQAQVSFGISVGQAPVCPYGYYNYSPYNCAPYGYYGPEWFNNGVFIGAGPWYHGRHDWHGHVDNHYDPRYGYHGDLPHRGEHGRAYNAHDFHGHDNAQAWHGNERGGNHAGDHGGDHDRGQGGDHDHH